MEDNNKSSKITIGDCAEFSDTRKKNRIHPAVEGASSLVTFKIIISLFLR